MTVPKPEPKSNKLRGMKLGQRLRISYNARHATAKFGAKRLTK